MTGLDVYLQHPVSVKVAGFTITAKCFRPNGALQEHHSQATVCVVTKGRISETDAQGVHAFGASDVVYRPPAEAHANAAGCSGADVVVVEACEARLSALERAGMPVNQFTAQQSPLASAIGSRIRKELAPQRTASPVILEGLALQLWGEALTSRTTGSAVPPWLLKVRNVVTEDPCRSHSISELAEVAGVSVSFLSKSAKKFLGSSLGELRLQGQVERAAQMLSDTCFPIADVALACGFYDQSHLTRVFLRMTGCTPNTYRRNLRG